MKKLVAVLLVFFIVMGRVSLMAQAKPRLTLDLTKLTAVNVLAGDKVGDPIGGTKLRNVEPFPKTYADLMILIPDMPGVNWAGFDRIIVKIRYFDASGKEMAQADTRAMVTLVYDINGDLRGPSMGPGPNTPLKVLNVGGYSSAISDTGSAMRLTKAPGAILFQNSHVDVKFIEVDEITFYKK
jgi:hypothetical protein